MKKHIVLALAAVLAAAPVFAQDAATTTTPSATAKKSKSSGVHKTVGRADKELTDLSASLNLTDDQKAKIKPIIDDKEAKMHTVKMDSTMSKDDQKSKSKVIRQDANTQIRALLTPDQQKNFDAAAKKEGKKKDTPATPPTT